MGKIAFVFSGQGDQYAGMGRSLSERYPAAARVFAACDRLRPGTSAQCFAGSEEELKETKNTQPCLFAYELALAAVLEEQGVRADLTAGFSLGEVAALTYAGAVEPDTGFSLVCRRGELMQEAAEAYPASMAAVVKLPPEEVSRIAAGFDRGFAAVFDGNVTVVIVSIILMGAFGPPSSIWATILSPLMFMFNSSITGSIYSFGYTLLVGSIFNLLIGVYMSRFMIRSLSSFKALRKPWLYGGVSHAK